MVRGTLVEGLRDSLNSIEDGVHKGFTIERLGTIISVNGSFEYNALMEHASFLNC